MNGSLAGKIAVVTGGGSGIGKAIAAAFVKAGAPVVVAGRGRDRLTYAAAASESVSEPMSRRAVLGGTAAIGLLAARGAHAADSTWDAIADSGVLRLGVLQNHSPYHKFTDGKWTGFAVRMGLDLAEAAGATMQKPLQVAYVETSLATVILDIQSNRLDAYFGLTASEERRKAVNLFGPIYELPECALNTRGFDPGDSWAAYDKPSVTIAVVIGSTDEQAARKMLPNAQIRALKSTSDAVLSIQAGNAQALIDTVLAGMMAHKQSPNLGAPVALQPLISQPSMGGTRRDSDGRFAAFCDGWAKQYRASGRAKQVILEAMQQAGLDAAALPPSLQF